VQQGSYATGGINELHKFVTQSMCNYSHQHLRMVLVGVVLKQWLVISCLINPASKGGRL
jgi:hypothetical protein